MDNLYGEHLVVKRVGGTYTHHGIGTGLGTVIHYSGLADGLSAGPVEEVSLAHFANGEEIFIKSYENRDSTYVTVARARSRLGENGYSVWGNNCEHFAAWCIMGDHCSAQVDRAGIVFTSAASAGMVKGTLGTVAAAGSVSGLSGSGIMSGLAAVTGSTVGGIATIAGAGGVGMATLMNNTVLKDDENLSYEEREARTAGRVATYTGAAAATAGGVATISAAGSVAGLSAAGITSGLAAIGGTVGGGMAAGTAIVAAAPVAAAAAVGYSVYKAFKWFKKR